MANYYEIDKERRLITSTASGVITLPEIWAHQEKLDKDPDFDPSFAQLLDVTQVTKLKLSSEDVRRVAESNTLSTNPRLAIVATSSLVYGMARMFQIFREMKGEEKTRVFRDRDEALAWVLGKDGAD
ncbi:MAG TPA: hypothetical protein VIX11_07310 [Candidatus Acidoferrum sp.]